MPQTCSMRLLRAASLRLRRLVMRSAVRWLLGTLPPAYGVEKGDGVGRARAERSERVARSLGESSA